MGTAAAMFNHAMTAGQALTGTAASPMDGSTSGTPGTSGTGSSGDSSSDSTTISANDFLTLLVTEMQNQDPTADTDPNEYIDQLVQVNSLEQLIDINQTLSGALGSTASSTGSESSAQVAGVANGAAATSPLTAAVHSPHAASALPASESAVSSGSAPATERAVSNRVPANVGVPRVNAAAERVGHALDGGTHYKPAKGSAIPLQ